MSLLVNINFLLYKSLYTCTHTRVVIQNICMAGISSSSSTAFRSMTNHSPFNVRKVPVILQKFLGRIIKCCNLLKMQAKSTFSSNAYFCCTENVSPVIYELCASLHCCTPSSTLSLWGLCSSSTLSVHVGCLFAPSDSSFLWGHEDHTGTGHNIIQNIY